MKIFNISDVKTELLKLKKIAVIGFGAQGQAQAMNLRDSGMNVAVGLRKDSPSYLKVEEAGLKAQQIEEATEWADIVMMLIPDEIQGEVYRNSIEKFLNPGKMLMFSHGFNIHFGQIIPKPGIDIAMVAPKGVGPMVRREFERGAGVPCLVAVHQDATGNALPIALAYAGAIGGSRAAILETTFKDETETDLFGEQAVLCGGASNLMKAGFETLVEAGYPPEMAYFECIHELKLIVDLIYERGFSGMRQAISNTAEYGDYASGSYVIDDSVKSRMKDVLKRIQTGEFAKNWMLENQVNKPSFNAQRKIWAELELEKTGERLRALMPWLKK